jgi:ankyrin repeat protein
MQLRTLLFPLIVLLAHSPLLAQTLPEQNIFQLKDMEEKGLNHNEWLLSQGILKQDVELVAHALNTGVDPNKAPRGGWPPLFSAVGVPSAKVALVSLLIEHGANVNARYDFQKPNCRKPESSAMERFNCEMIARTQQMQGYFPLYQAAANGNAQVVDLLLNHKADVHARLSNGATAMFGTYDVETGKVLLRHGADINAKNNSGQTVLLLTKRFASQLSNTNNYMRPKVEVFLEWLVSQGAVE